MSSIHRATLLMAAAGLLPAAVVAQSADARFAGHARQREQRPGDDDVRLAIVVGLQIEAITVNDEPGRQ